MLAIYTRLHLISCAMAVDLEVGCSETLIRMNNKKKRAWGDDEQKLLNMMMGYAPDSHSHSHTLDLLGSSPSQLLELGQEQALPLGWEKRLDLKSGRVYFINWNTGITTLDDPRKAIDGKSNSVQREKSDVDLKLKLCVEDELENERATPQCLWLLSSNPDSRQDEFAEVGESDAMTMLTACKRCLMYVMISPSDPRCPKCESNVLLHFPTFKKRKVERDL